MFFFPATFLKQAESMVGRGFGKRPDFLCFFPATFLKQAESMVKDVLVSFNRVYNTPFRHGQFVAVSIIDLNEFCLVFLAKCDLKQRNDANQICLLLQYKLGSPLSMQEAKKESFKHVTQ